MKKVRFEGIVRASGYAPGALGKQFLGAILECSGEKQWVIDYDEQSPFHAFADRPVVVSGEPYDPDPQHGQHLIGRSGDQKLGHLRVLTMRLAEMLPDARFVEVGAEQSLSGRFERDTSDSGDSMLSFVTMKGDRFLVANDPAGATVGRSGEVRAYPIQLSSSIPRPPEQYLWIICPCSAADLWEWRGRHA